MAQGGSARLHMPSRSSFSRSLFNLLEVTGLGRRTTLDIWEGCSAHGRREMVQTCAFLRPAEWCGLRGMFESRQPQGWCCMRIIQNYPIQAKYADQASGGRGRNGFQPRWPSFRVDLLHHLFKNSIPSDNRKDTDCFVQNLKYVSKQNIGRSIPMSPKMGYNLLYGISNFWSFSIYS